MLVLVVLWSLFLFAPLLFAQEMRTVTQPKLPPICASLDAHLVSHHGALAAADERKLDTRRIQKAIDGCSRNHGVALRTHGAANAFLSGPLELRPGVTLIVGKGVTLFASRDARLYEESPGSCGVVNHAESGCKPLILVQDAADASVMGDGAIDGRGASTLLGRNVSWWQLAMQARAGGNQQVPVLIVADRSDNFTLYRITLKNSANHHVIYSHGNGFTVWGLKIDTPGVREARNTDGVDPENGARNITITHSYISTGDDNVAIHAGQASVTNVSVIHNHFYLGHGMSIGSGTRAGVSHVLVKDLSLDGTHNGIRIKSNGSAGGLVHDVTYDDICIRNSPEPILLTAAYTAAGTLRGKFPPTFRDIRFHNVQISGGKGGTITFVGYSHEHRVQANLDGVTMSDPAAYTSTLRHVDLYLGRGPVNLRLSRGPDSTVTGKPGRGTLPSCTGRFVPFPRR
jgi:polygalacturonase